jgi:hypothetical protein
MEISVLLAAFAGLALLLIILTLYKRYVSKTENDADKKRGIAARPAAQQQRQIPRRAVAARNVRNRRVADARRDDSDAEEEGHVEHQDDDDATEGADHLFSEELKMGAKKRAKLEAKAEKKAQREAEQREREEKKMREDLLAVERDRETAARQLEEEKAKEAERLAREEKERKEQEEYLALKAAFQVESEGFEQEDFEGEENSLRAFVQHIMDSKVVVLEDLAAKFKLKTQNVIDRITQLQEDGVLTGVVDDRGKFIFISREELENFAKFIRQRGRVNISDLAAASNSLINLTPEQPAGL